MSEKTYLKEESLNFLIAHNRDGGDEDKHLKNIAETLYDKKYNSRMESLAKIESKVRRALLHKKDQHLTFSLNRDEDDVEFDPEEIEWRVDRNWPKRRISAHDRSEDD